MGGGCLRSVSRRSVVAATSYVVLAWAFRVAPVRDWLRQLQADSLEFMAYEYTPLPKLREWSEVSGGAALFDQILVMTNYPTDFVAAGVSSTWSVVAV